MIQFIFYAFIILLVIGICAAFLPYIIGIAVIIGLIWLAVNYWAIGLVVFCLFLLLGIIVMFYNKRKAKLWLEEDCPSMDLGEIDGQLREITQSCRSYDLNQDDAHIYHVYDKAQILPYENVNTFLSQFGKFSRSVEVYYFSTLKSKKKLELRDYGILIARDGIFISHKDDDEVKNIFIPFAGIMSSDLAGDKFTFSYIDSKKAFEEKTINKSETSLDLVIIHSLVKHIIDSKITHSLYKNKVTATTIIHKVAKKTMNTKHQTLASLEGLDTAPEVRELAAAVPAIEEVIDNETKESQAAFEEKQTKNEHQNQEHAVDFENSMLSSLLRKKVSPSEDAGFENKTPALTQLLNRLRSYK